MTGRIVFGDNLPVLRAMADGSVPLIYLDPPFNTGKTGAASRARATRR
jgi:site-specific DNA-methyltransferase (adenine-specific)